MRGERESEQIENTIVLLLFLFRVLYDQFNNSDKSTVSNLSGIQLVGIAVANELNPYDTNTAGSLDQGL